ncbi:hypothetical protein F0L74_09695 [Chitinophaga agrisoli]|uniref:Uncharacterized protein n=1 Tax=Chitinophaga agrisoli TaxID=2607653 RepID=A0A5B2VU85_9BACT|nr:hypothetical protein [Chitinophaga agrisoli]KAA2242791.1 hypothetical protein F0L74_09695 [Chitinophaga agrisoli]
MKGCDIGFLFQECKTKDQLIFQIMKMSDEQYNAFRQEIRDLDHQRGELADYRCTDDSEAKGSDLFTLAEVPKGQYCFHEGK